ncbi:MAG: hypothetical protein KAX26_12670, partial [Anaerolineae bacterium]|nr:hypothetical protein [Anaerolineae bacterium]
INLAALPGGTALTEAILVENGASRWYALTYGLYIGLLMPVRLDLTEPLAYLFVQVGVLAFSRGRTWPSAAWFMLAALTRETTLLFALAYGLHLLSIRRWEMVLGWGSVVIFPFLAWQIVLRIWLGSWGLGSGGALSTPFEFIPFRGWWMMASINLPAFVVMSLVVVPLALLPAVLSLIAALRALGARMPRPCCMGASDQCSGLSVPACFERARPAGPITYDGGAGDGGAGLWRTAARTAGAELCLALDHPDNFPVRR